MPARLAQGQRPRRLRRNDTACAVHSQNSKAQKGGDAIVGAPTVAHLA